MSKSLKGWAVFALLLAVLGAACDEVSPVAPTGTTLTVSANPTRIDPGGTSEITVLARKENGSPVNPGTQIFLTTTLGAIDELAATNDNGIARATLTGDGRVGVATVSATSGDTETITTDVEIGSLAGSITLQPSPTTISTATASSTVFTLTATVRDETGQPLEGVAVNFTTQLGSLVSQGRPIFTDADGVVEDTLTVTPQEVSSLTAPTFDVGALVAGPDGDLLEDTFQIRVQSSAPIASFVARRAGGNQVFFDNRSTGAEPLSFEWDFTNDGTIDSTERSPTHDYGGSVTLTVTVRLTATNSLGSDISLQTITVPIP